MLWTRLARHYAVNRDLGPKLTMIQLMVVRAQVYVCVVCAWCVRGVYVHVVLLGAAVVFFHSQKMQLTHSCHHWLLAVFFAVIVSAERHYCVSGPDGSGVCGVLCCPVFNPARKLRMAGTHVHRNGLFAACVRLTQTGTHTDTLAYTHTHTHTHTLAYTHTHIHARTMNRFLCLTFKSMASCSWRRCENKQTAQTPNLPTAAATL